MLFYELRYKKWKTKTLKWWNFTRYNQSKKQPLTHHLEQSINYIEVLKVDEKVIG
jgi:hypothetical protein